MDLVAFSVVILGSRLHDCGPSRFRLFSRAFRSMQRNLFDGFFLSLLSSLGAISKRTQVRVVITSEDSLRPLDNILRPLDNNCLSNLPSLPYVVLWKARAVSLHDVIWRAILVGKVGKALAIGFG